MNNIKTRLFLLFIGILLLFANYVVLKEDFIAVSYGWEKRLAIAVVTIVIYAGIIWKLLKLRFYSPLFFILLSLYMFHLSSIPYFGFFENLDYEGVHQLYRFNKELSFWGVVYSGLFIISYLIGVIIFAKPEIYDVSSKNSDPIAKKVLLCSRRVGIFLFCFSVLPELYFDISQAMAKTVGGYEFLMTENNITFYGIPLGYFTKMFIPSILIILSSYRYEKKEFRKIFVLALVYFVLLMLLTGRRGNSIQAIIPLIFIYCYFYRPKFNFGYIFLGYVSLVLFNVITNTRKFATGEELFNEMKASVVESSPIKDVCMEMGGTIKAPIQALMAIPATGDYQYGLSYPASVIYAISAGLHMPIQSIKPYAMFNEYLTLSERGSDIHETVAYMGGSIIAEWYWNFGWIGIFMVPLLVFFFCKYEKRMISVSQRPVTFALWVVVLYFFTRWSRGYFTDVVWNLFFIYVFAKAYIRIKYKKTRRAL